MYELTGKVAIVTGAAAGLGQAIAATFAKQGAKVVPTDRPGVSMDETIEMCKKAGVEEVYTHDLDVTDQDSIAKAIADVKEKYGSIDILASNAGLNRPMPLSGYTGSVGFSYECKLTWCILHGSGSGSGYESAGKRTYHFHK